MAQRNTQMERGARTFFLASFRSTMSVGVLMALNIYEKYKLDSKETRESSDSLSNIEL